MEDKKMNWSKPLLLELEKATYTVGQTCSAGPTFLAACAFGNGNSVSCTQGVSAGSLCYKGSTPSPQV
jgi:hypothetical protein